MGIGREQFNSAEIGEQFPFGDGDFALLFGDAHTVRLFRVGYQGQVNNSGRLSNGTADHGQVCFLDLSVFEHLAVGCLGLFVSGKQQKAAGLFIESMNKAQLIDAVSVHLAVQ